MKKRNVGFLCLGILLGVLIGYLLSNRLSANSKQDQAGSTKRDQVLAKIDVGASVGWAGEGKWTLVSIPHDAVNENHSSIVSPPAEARISTTSRRFAIRCNLPETTVDQEQTFFNRLCNHLRDSISKHAVTWGGGEIGQVPLFTEKGKEKPGRFYCGVIHFHTTPEHPNPDSRGGLRGTATIWVTSDGKSASALVTLTEVTQGDR